MKHIISSIFCSLVLATSAMAAEITLFVGSKPGGNMYDMSQLLADHLVSKGHKIDFQVMGNCTKAQSAMDSNSGKSITIVYNAFVNLPGCESSMPSEKSYVSNLLSFPLMVCGKPDLSLDDIVKSQKSGTVAIIKSNPTTLVTSLNPNFTAVPYTNSGAASKGFLAGDTDFIMTTTPKAAKLVDAGKAKCFLTTGSETTLGAEPAEKLIPQWSYKNLVAAVSVNQRGFDDSEISKLKEDVISFANSESWVKYAEKSKANVDTQFKLERFQETANQWISK